MLITLIYLAPIIISIIALIIDFRRGINKRALLVAGAATMIVEMFAMKYIANTWYVFCFSIFVPLAVIYTAISLYLSIKEDKENKEGK